MDGGQSGQPPGGLSAPYAGSRNSPTASRWPGAVPLRCSLDRDEVERSNSARTPKTISILGATGSIGQSTLDLIERNPAA